MTTRAPLGIAVENLTKRFGAGSALDDVSLTVVPGELLALLGPSGSGKTTLLRSIAGLETADSGRILFDGVDASALSVQARNIGFVFQHYALFGHMSVADNIAYGLRARRDPPPRAAVAARVADLLDLMQLAGMGARFPAQLSGGQRQRVALARALAIEPRALLLDEPFGALDARVRRDLRRWLRDIHARTGQTTVFVTHDQDEATDLADRVAILDRGRIEQVGAPADIYDEPASAFVALFVGNATALDVVVREGAVWLGGRSIGAADARREGPAQAFVRPSEVTLAAPDATSLAGVVHRVAALAGGGRRVEVLLDGTTAVIEAETDAARDWPVGARVSVHLSRLRIFPKPA